MDSFLTVAVSSAGYRQMIFMPPACVFHQYHPQVCSLPGVVICLCTCLNFDNSCAQGIMPQRVAETVGQPEIDSFVKNVTQMLAEREPIMINGPVSICFSFSSRLGYLTDRYHAELGIRRDGVRRGGNLVTFIKAYFFSFLAIYTSYLHSRWRSQRGGACTLGCTR